MRQAVQVMQKLFEHPLNTDQLARIRLRLKETLEAMRAVAPLS